MRPRRVRSDRVAASAPSPAAGGPPLAVPLILITALAAMALLYIYSCARESELDLQVRYANRQVEQLRAERMALCARINQARDPAYLRQIAVQQGMVFTPAGVDRIALSRPLPPAQATLSPLADLPANPPGTAPLPAAALAGVPPGAR